MKSIICAILLIAVVVVVSSTSSKVNINNQPFTYKDDDPIYNQKKYTYREMYPKAKLTSEQKSYIETRDKFVDNLLSKMSIKEKVGQMTQIDVNKLLIPGTVQLNETYVDEITAEFQIGSFLNSPTTGGIVDGVINLNATQWIDMLTTLQKITVKNSPTSTPMIYGIDSIHGGTYIYRSTLFPHGTGMGATFNPDLVHTAQTISAKDSIACGMPWVFSPVLGLGMQPLWSRFYETYGEDPYLACRLGEASIQGLQGNGNPFTGNVTSPSVVGTAKHYFGYSNPVNGKDRTAAWIPERMMRHYFLPSFAQALAAGAGTVMVNSAEINGIPMHASEKYIAGVLREELEFDGVAVSDWQDIEKLHFFHKIAPTMVQAIELALNAGIDMSMVADDFSFPRLLLRMVENGRIPESRLDMSVRRILNLKYSVGLFEQPYPVVDEELINSIGQLEDREVAANAVAESVTLLQNNNDVLPLNPSKIGRILVTGPSADSLPNQNGGWTNHWQGSKYNWEFPFGTTIFGGIQEYLNQTSAQVIYKEGTVYGVVNQTMLDEAAMAAGESDAVVVCLGELPEAEGMGDINDLTMDSAQLILLETLIQSTDAPIILILIEARPRIIPPTILSQVSAVMMAFLPGSEAGKPIAEIIFGDISPSGRLPITYPAYTGDISPYYYKYSMVGAHTPQWDFGTGLSYTQFSYANIHCNGSKIGPLNYTGSVGDYVRISVEITNVGKMIGKETAMLFLSKEFAQVTPEVRMLKGFRKIELNPGDSQIVDFVLTPREFSFIGIDNKITIETGQFFINIGSQSITFYLA